MNKIRSILDGNDRRVLTFVHRLDLVTIQNSPVSTNLVDLV